MLSPQRRPQLDFVRRFIDGFGQAASAADFPHPSTGQHYSEFIDVDAWIDHHIINALNKNVDGLRFSAYFHKERGSRLAAGPVWDFDRSLGTPYDARAAEPEEWNRTWNATDYSNEGWWGLLFRDPDFRSRYRTRFEALLNGEFSADTLDRIVDRLASEVGDAADRNFRHWAEFRRETTRTRLRSHCSGIFFAVGLPGSRPNWRRTSERIPEGTRLPGPSN